MTDDGNARRATASRGMHLVDANWLPLSPVPITVVIETPNYFRYHNGLAGVEVNPVDQGGPKKRGNFSTRQAAFRAAQPQGKDD